MKHHIQIPTRGWLPQDPYIPSHLKINLNKTRQRSKVKTAVGSALLLFGLVAIVISLATVQKTNEIFNDSFSLNSNQKDTPFEASYNSHTSSLYITQPVLQGRIVVNGENVEFTVISKEQQTKTVVFNGKTINYTGVSQDPKYSHQVISTTVDNTYSFNLPRNGSYQFTFQNPSSQQATVDFHLKATWTNTGMLIPGSIALLCTALPGTALIVIGRRGKKVLLQPCA